MVNFCQILITIGVMFCLQNKGDIKKRQQNVGAIYHVFDFEGQKRLINHQAQPFFLFDHD